MPVLFLLPLALFLSQATSKDSLIGDCRRDIDIRNHPRDLLQLRGCRVVDGFLRVVLMDNASPESYANMTFPELRVVTSYVLVMRLAGVRSLGQLFPNLSVIRGYELIMDTYALVVYDMPDLTELNLPKLRNILNGSVSIVKNPRLCFADTIAWDVIAPNGFNTTLRDNQDALQCLECRCPGQHCWGESSCQDRSPLMSEEVAGIAGRVPCNERCVGGCTGPSDRDCFSCANFEHQGRCVPRCPGNPKHPYNMWLTTLGRLCLSEYRCRSTWNGTKFNGACVLECPPGYERVGNQNTSTCDRSRSASTKLICKGMAIRVSEDARLLRGCTIINGSLEIEIASGSNVERDLEISLGSIREIMGSLIVSRSRVLSSLRFLRSLQTIGGQDSNWNITLLVHLNDNLQQLFDWEEQAKSLNVSSPHGGDAIFYFNPRLCHPEIARFREAAKLKRDSVLDVLNGFSCGMSNLAPLVVRRDSEAVVLAWAGAQGTSADDLLGYAVYHVEAAARNVTEYAGLCIDNMEWEDGWVVHEVHLQEGSVNVSHFLLPHLRPATQYAFYVKIYKRSGNEHSSIQYFRTLPARPSPPIDVRTADTSHSGDGLTVHWDPPMKPNGGLSHYIVIGELQEDEARQLEDRDYCVQPPNGESSANEHGTYSAGVSRHQLDSCPLIEERCERLLQMQEAACPDALGRCAHALYSIVSEKLKPTSLADTAFPALLPENLPAPGVNLSQLSEPGTHTRSWLRRFVLVVPAGDTSCIARGLRPFGRYAIEVRACGHKPQEEDGGGVGHPLSALCSAASWVWGRNPPLADADLVRAPRLTPHPGAIQLNWSEPALPNGLVVSYQIRYENVLANQSQEVCVSRQTHRAQGGPDNGGVLLELAPGAYSIQLRATSLGGRGPWVRAGMTTVAAVVPKSADQGAGHSATLALVIVSILAMMLTVIVLLLRRRRRLQREEEDTQRLVEADLADYWDFPWDDWPRPDRVAHFHRDVNDPSDEGQMTIEDKELHALPPNDPDDSVWCATGVRQESKRNSFSVRQKLQQTNPFLQPSTEDLYFTECSTRGRSTNPFLSDMHLDDVFATASEGLHSISGQMLHDSVGFLTDRSELTSSANSLNNHSPKLISLSNIENEYESVLQEENSSANAECSERWNIKKGDESEDDCSFESVNLDGGNNI